MSIYYVIQNKCSEVGYYLSKRKNQGRRKLALFHSKTSSVSFHTYFFMTEYIKFDEFSYKLKGL